MRLALRHCVRRMYSLNGTINETEKNDGRSRDQLLKNRSGLLLNPPSDPSVMFSSNFPYASCSDCICQKNKKIHRTQSTSDFNLLVITSTCTITVSAMVITGQPLQPPTHCSLVKYICSSPFLYFHPLFFSRQFVPHLHDTHFLSSTLRPFNVRRRSSTCCRPVELFNVEAFFLYIFLPTTE